LEAKMFWINLLKQLISILNSKVSPAQIAGGVALGSIMGFTPFNALHASVIFVLIMIINVNLAAAFLSTALFTAVSFILDPIAHKIGYYLLVTNEALEPVWESLYNMPIVPFTRFNNTVVLGSFVISIILFVPVFLLSKYLIIYYRAHLQTKVANLKIVKILNLSNIFNIYDKFKENK
jgi:uncharacterized protein (TIGR03546 family)